MRFVLLASSCLFPALVAQAPQTIGTWTAVNTTVSPPPRERAQLVYDPVRDIMFLTGGIPLGGGNALSDVWEFQAGNWVQRFPAHPLNLHSRPARFVFCPTRGRVLVLDGDSASGGVPMALSEWTGTDFVPIPSNAPISRSNGFEIAWDSGRNVLVMFGGGIAGADTWEWDGTSWRQRGTGGPPGRSGERLVYDAARGCTVLYGGMSTVRFDDTWEWDGNVWRECFGIASAGVYDGSGMVYDAALQRCVLFGGNLTNGGRTNRVSLYDGTSWSAITTFGAPGYVVGPALAHDSLRNRILSFGGYIGNAMAGTMSLDIRTGVAASFGPHGAGCPGPAGVPTVTARNATRPVLGSTFELRYGNLPNTPLALVFSVLGFDDQNWNGAPLPLDLAPLGMPNCMLRVGPQFVQPLANVSGAADWQLPIPALPAFDGVPFFVQAAVLSGGTNAAGIIVSNSGRGLLGAL